MTLQGPHGIEERFTLLPTTRYVSWVAVAVGALLALLATVWWWRLLGGGMTIAMLAASWVVRRRRPVLILDDSGYRDEVAGRERFRVGWDEVRRVLRDRQEAAVYVDCGDGKRNLLVPPESGFAFTFTGRARLVERIVALLEAKVQDVERFDKLALPAPALSSDAAKKPV